MINEIIRKFEENMGVLEIENNNKKIRFVDQVNPTRDIGKFSKKVTPNKGNQGNEVINHSIDEGRHLNG